MNPNYPNQHVKIAISFKTYCSICSVAAKQTTALFFPGSADRKMQRKNAKEQSGGCSAQVLVLQEEILGFITLLQECCEVKQRYLEKQLNQHQSNLYKLEFTWKDK